jgi:hypothetical protein
MADGRNIPEHVARLLASSIESVERLDILLHLRSVRGKACGARAVAAACHVKTSAVEEHLAILCGRGFLTVSIGSDLLYAFQPISPTIDKVLDEVAKLSVTHRAEVEAAMRNTRDRDPVRAFANAFLLRRDAKKGSGDG